MDDATALPAAHPADGAADHRAPRAADGVTAGICMAPATTPRMADGGPPPPWLQAALSRLAQLLHAQSAATPGARPPQLVLHLDTAATAPAALLEPALASVHWALCDAAGRVLCRQQPLHADITAGRGIALRCLQRDAHSGRWHERRALHVASTSRLEAGLNGLVEAVARLLALALLEHRLGTPLPATALPLLAAPHRAGLLHRGWRMVQGRARSAARRVRALALTDAWRIGVIDLPVAQLLQPGPLPPVRWLTPADARGYWADPFGLPGDPHRIACEFFDRQQDLGRLECLTLGADGMPAQRQTLAVGEGAHASFPLVCTLDGQSLAVAETLDARSVWLHTVAADGSWRPLWPLLQDVVAADPALFKWQGRYWLAYTDTALGWHDNLCLQHAPSLRGPWRPHAANPVKVDVASARMAGSLFVHDGALYRPGQDCLHGYGGAAVLHRIDTLTTSTFAETAMRRLAPDPGSSCPHGLHTVSGWGARTLVDGNRLTLQPAALLHKLRSRARGRMRAAFVPRRQDPGGAVFVYVPHLRTGGGELSMLELAAGLADAGRPVWLVVHTARTQELTLPAGVQLLTLGREGTAGALWRLAALVRSRRPQWLVSAFPHSNVAAVAAVALARLDPRCATRCVVSEHAPVSLQRAQHADWRWRVLPPLLRWAYPRADAVVAVSDGVRDDLLALLGAGGGQGRRRVAPLVIRNPVLPPTLDAELAAAPDHPWLRDPALDVVLSVGRLADEKDLPTLLEAFATLHRSRPATRLLLAGEGPERPRLEALVARLGLQAVVQLPGRTCQPLRWMHHAAVLVLASRFEGFGNVLVEALACGTPVVATDCPVGPREILQGGRFGALVPVGDARAMAGAIVQALLQRAPPPGARAAALQYTRQRASAAYLALFDSLDGSGAAAAAANGPAPC